MMSLCDVTVFNFTGVYESEDFYKDIDNPRFIECRNIPGTDCLCDEEGEKEIRRRMEEAHTPINGIHFIDNGNYHYMSYVFTSYIKEPFHLIYFDNHPDLKPSMFGDILSCGSWVKKVLDTNTHVRKVIAAGVNGKLFEEIDENDSKKVTLVSFCDEDETTLEKENLTEDKVPSLNNSLAKDKTLADKLLDELSDDLPIYISIDKDVLAPDQLMTNWDQGTMKADTLIGIVKRLLGSKKVLGLDICGEVSHDTDCDQDKEINRNNSFNRGLLTEILFQS